MANLRRTKLKARRVGCNVPDVEKCKTKEEVEKLVSELNKKDGANHSVADEDKDVVSE